jgi:hypothetical protein
MILIVAVSIRDASYLPALFVQENKGSNIYNNLGAS